MSVWLRHCSEHLQPISEYLGFGSSCYSLMCTLKMITQVVGFPSPIEFLVPDFDLGQPFMLYILWEKQWVKDLSLSLSASLPFTEN